MEDARKAFANVMGSLSDELIKEVGKGFANKYKNMDPEEVFRQNHENQVTGASQESGTARELPF